MSTTHLITEAPGVGAISRDRTTAAKEIHLAGWVRELVGAYKEGLDRLYGERLEGLYLFGSHARGEVQLDSDVDLVVVLDVICDN